MPAQAVSPAILRHRLGHDLRRLREARPLRLEDVAAHLGVAPSTLSRIETGKAPTRTAYLYLMLDLYGVDDPDQRRMLADLAREGQRKGWWTRYDDCSPGEHQYLGLETAAVLVRSYSVLAVPGLLQTPDYAVAAIRAARPDLTAARAARLAEIEKHRQEQARTSGQRLHLVIDGSALLRPVAPAHVMAAQMDTPRPWRPTRQ
jgi:transcriptional regulator with XRE-family HTH domain